MLQKNETKIKILKKEIQSSKKPPSKLPWKFVLALLSFHRVSTYRHHWHDVFIATDCTLAWLHPSCLTYPSLPSDPTGPATPNINYQRESVAASISTVPFSTDQYMAKNPHLLKQCILLVLVTSLGKYSFSLFIFCCLKSSSVTAGWDYSVVCGGLTVLEPALLVAQSCGAKIASYVRKIQTIPSPQTGTFSLLKLRKALIVMAVPHKIGWHS